MLGRDYYHRSNKQSCRNQLRSHLFRHKLATLCYVYRNDNSITSWHTVINYTLNNLSIPHSKDEVTSPVSTWDPLHGCLEGTVKLEDVAEEILQRTRWKEIDELCEMTHKSLHKSVWWPIFNSLWKVFQILTLCQRNHLGKSPQSLRWPSSVMRYLEFNGSS